MIKKKPTKVALVGTSHHTTFNVRRYFGNPDWEIWPINDMYGMFPELLDHATRWFQLHSLEYLVDQRNMSVERLKTVKFPVYMQKHYEEIPTSVAYPKEEILKEFGYYFTNSFAWMMALAMREKFKEIHLYGIDFATEVEYFQERPAMEYYIGLARGRGIKVFVPQESDLLKSSFLYGFDERVDYLQNLRLKLKSYEARRQETYSEYVDATYRAGRARGVYLATDKASEDWEEVDTADTEAMLRRESAKNHFQQWTGACDILQMMLRTWMHKGDFNRLEDLN